MRGQRRPLTAVAGCEPPHVTVRVTAGSGARFSGEDKRMESREAPANVEWTGDDSPMPTAPVRGVRPSGMTRSRTKR